MEKMDILRLGREEEGEMDIFGDDKQGLRTETPISHIGYGFLSKKSVCQIKKACAKSGGSKRTTDGEDEGS